METGISNLTEEASPALVHFEDGQTQQVLLVRMEDPEGSGRKSWQGPEIPGSGSSPVLRAPGFRSWHYGARHRPQRSLAV